MEKFEAYFRRADLDNDGRISGQEAVSFFQGSNLPKHILAQIWMHADQNRTGFLGWAEFYNALRLVTVAQSGRELTPEIVKAALFGPAAAKIPAPQINFAALATPQLNSAAHSAPQSSTVAPNVAQNPAFRGQQGLVNARKNQQFFASAGSQSARPPLPTSTASPTTFQGPGQGIPRAGSMMGPCLPNSDPSNLSSEWFGPRPAVASMGGMPQVPNRGVSSLMTQDGLAPLGSAPPVQPRPPASSGLAPSGQDGFRALASPGFTSSMPPRQQAPPGQMPSFPSKARESAQSSIQSSVKDSKALSASGNGFTDSIFGGDVFSVTPQSKEADAAQRHATTSAAISSAIVPVVSEQSSDKPSQVDAFQSLAMTTNSSQLQQLPSQIEQNQPAVTQSISASMTPGISVGTSGSASVQTQPPWPKMTQSAIQKYTKVFMEVDTDRDGKITGEQARNLFLSWRLRREVLKQVWDLSDQDSDSMLSLREFCTALYLMERYREGSTLPPVLPDSIRLDETLLRATAHSTAAYRWQPPQGLPHQGYPGVRSVPVTGLRPSHVPIPQGDMLHKSRMPVLEKYLSTQVNNEEQSGLNSMLQESSGADAKVKEPQMDSLDSREKIEFYRTKMQELVLYKSRCDNRLNEIAERASADKREVEALAKKYEEKYKQVGELASKLTIEDSTFREIQEQKMELYNAIVKMEQGGIADGLLQVRADRIHSDLEGLAKALHERCKKHGLHVKQMVLIDLPFGWSPGIQDGAADWDEDWDKFEDEGFTTSKDLTVDVESMVAPSGPTHVWSDKFSTSEFSPTIADSKIEKPCSTGDIAEEGSIFIQSEDDTARSPSRSPHGRSLLESPSQEFSASHFGKTVGPDALPQTKESQSDHGGTESIVSGDKFDEPSWGATFDGSDDTDSLWDFNPIKTKDSDLEQSRRNSFFGSGELGLNPTRIDLPNANSFLRKEKSSFFADSVPSTPLFNSGSSPADNKEHSFDNFTRFDSFGTNDSGLFGSRESFARFDSIRSTGDSDAPRDKFLRFDSINRIGDFDSSRDSFPRFDSSTRDSDPPRDSFSRFDSIHSTRDSERSRGFTSFDDSDPFGSSGPFKSSQHQSRQNSDSWSAF